MPAANQTRTTTCFLLGSNFVSSLRLSFDGRFCRHGFGQNDEFHETIGERCERKNNISSFDGIGDWRPKTDAGAIRAFRAEIFRCPPIRLVIGDNEAGFSVRWTRVDRVNQRIAGKMGYLNNMRLKVALDQRKYSVAPCRHDIVKRQNIRWARREKAKQLKAKFSRLPR